MRDPTARESSTGASCPPGRGCRQAAKEAVGPHGFRVSPLWTLQRLCFGPDVAAAYVDRGENRDPGKAIAKRKKQLTQEARLENGPSGSRAWARVLTGDRQRSCVRPHMRAFSSSSFVMRTSAWVEGIVVRYHPRRSSRQRRISLRTSHPAGHCPHHGPAFGTGELQESGTTL